MKLNTIFVIIIAGLMVFACLKNPTEQTLEQKPDDFIPVSQPGLSVILSYTWADTSGDGNPEYFGNSVSTAGHVDSLWFNFQEPSNVNINYAVLATPTSGGETQIIASGEIPTGSYQYGFKINKDINVVSTYRISLTAFGHYPLPLSAYLRVDF